jgi:hypothetical protein
MTDDTNQQQWSATQPKVDGVERERSVPTMVMVTVAMRKVVDNINQWSSVKVHVLQNYEKRRKKNDVNKRLIGCFV